MIEKILAAVSTLLARFGEFKEAGIIGIIMEFLKNIGIN